jgi:hypothetical protein
MVNKEEHPGKLSCHEFDLWKERHGFNWTIERPTCLVCKGGHKEDQMLYKNKYEWVQKKPKTSMTSEHGTPEVIPTTSNSHTTNNSTEGRTSTTQVEITPQQLDCNGKNTAPPSKKSTSKMSSNSKTGPISKALYEEKESELDVSHHLLKTQKATTRRLGSKLSSFKKAEKDRLYRERQEEIISRQTNVPVASKNVLLTVDSRRCSS